MSSVVTVAQTTQITGPVWHSGPTPRSSFTNIHLKLASPPSPKQVLLSGPQGKHETQNLWSVSERRLSRLHSPASGGQSRREENRSVQRWVGWGSQTRTELDPGSSVSAVLLCLLWALKPRGQPLWVPKRKCGPFPFVLLLKDMTDGAVDARLDFVFIKELINGDTGCWLR